MEYKPIIHIPYGKMCVFASTLCKYDFFHFAMRFVNMVVCVVVRFVFMPCSVMVGLC